MSAQAGRVRQWADTHPAAARAQRPGDPLEVSTRPRASRAHSFRPDVEGLRAVAIALVVLYHAGLKFIPGGFVGVDVFFVVSGFLITSQLVSELERRGGISIVAFYARRAKRILPASALVLAVTAMACWWIVPRIWWRDISGDIVSSGLYVANWRFAARSVDYLQAGSPASPVQHFWSLAVEEQFYLIWPFVILVASAMGARVWSRRRASLAVGLAIVAVPSFVWSVVHTHGDPKPAFFVTTTRLWELAVGAAVALAAVQLARTPAWLARSMAWTGIVAIIGSGFVFSASSEWPGYLAAFPTGGAALVIAAGLPVHGGGRVAAALSRRPLQWLGGLSYSLYLWHWPVLVLAAAHWGPLSQLRGLAVATASVVPAWLSYRLVENPVRYARVFARSHRYAIVTGVACSAVAVIAGLGLRAVVPVVPAQQDTTQAPGAAAVGTDPPNDPVLAPRSVLVMTPDPLNAAADRPFAQEIHCLQTLESAIVNVCGFGDPSAPTKVAVVGDSKALQWLPALEMLAVNNGWYLTTYTKASCALSQSKTLNGSLPFPSCDGWNKSALGMIVAAHPDFVITSQDARFGVGSDGKPSMDALVTGMRASWARITAVGAKVLVIGDTPVADIDIDQCVDDHRDDLTQCTYPKSIRNNRGGYTTQALAVTGQPNVALLDFYDIICPAPRCWPVIGTVLIYRSGSHITATYVRTMTPRIAAALTVAGLPAHQGPIVPDEKAWKILFGS